MYNKTVTPKKETIIICPTLISRDELNLLHTIKAKQYNSIQNSLNYFENKYMINSL